MKKILLIEDNDDIRENTAEILELANYKVTTAANGKKGVELALKNQPDLIICDIMMPELDGYGVLHAIHKNEAIKNTPFIFLTAKTERNDLRKGMDLGADDYITKPFSGTELLNAIDGRLKKIDLLRKAFSPDLTGLENLIETSSGKHTLKSLTDAANTNTYKKKQIIYSENNHPIRLYYILKGKVKTFKSNDIGKDLITELYNAGDFLGHIALLKGSTYNDTAEALEDAELAVIPKEEFEALINSNSEVAKKFIQLLAKNVSEKESQLLGMAYNSLRKKVAEAILLLQKKYHEDKSKPFVIDISREGLATIAGTATESLIRTLSDFRSEKLIDLKDGHITILNQNKLEHLLN
jgi:CRP/FNR family transcriptional regulator, cyclic AMP receptor protein